jgi:hypothetical protein
MYDELKAIIQSFLQSHCSQRLQVELFTEWVALLSDVTNGTNGIACKLDQH